MSDELNGLTGGEMTDAELAKAYDPKANELRLPATDRQDFVKKVMRIEKMLDVNIPHVQSAQVTRKQDGTQEYFLPNAVE